MLNISPDVIEYNRIAESYLRHPPTPKLSALSVAWYKKSLDVDPDYIPTYLGLAKAYHQLGHTDEALYCCETAFEREPGSLAVHFAKCMLQLPILYQSQEEIVHRRQQYRHQLIALRERVAQATPQAIASVAETVGTITPFYLIYQAQDDQELQQLYGDLICQIMMRRYPQWTNATSITPPEQGKEIRIGIVSRQFHQHSVWKMVIKGWLSQLDRERFQLFGYALGAKEDGETEIARSYLHHYVTGDHSVEEWATLIAADRLHILLYPEVSMHNMAIKLSALRIAPVQCTTWATYVTSGLPTLDYYLSGALIEPEANQYSERLVRLPNLSVYYEPPNVEPATLERDSFGLRESSVVYFCGQSLFKYLPQYDDLFPRIAQAVGDCQFVFLKNKQSEGLTSLFYKRLQNAFVVAGLDPEQYVVMQPTLTDAAYHRLNQLSDIFLDSIGVGGATSTSEAICHDLPIVTLPSQFMRGRFSRGILRRMGISETIATSVDEFVEIAVRLGRDSGQRQDLRLQMGRNKHLIYRDRVCIDALEQFFASVIVGRGKR